ncbi:MAG: Mobile element protein, partial [Olavius algarvensis Gamma 3 endosymbiont]
MKPFVIGRKNWMFSNTGNGARASAMLYSIIETAKANGLIPFDYLRNALQAIAENPKDVDA